MAITINFAGMTKSAADCLVSELDDVGERVTVGGTLAAVQRAGDQVSVELSLDADITVVMGGPAAGPVEDAPPLAKPNYDLN